MISSKASALVKRLAAPTALLGRNYTQAAGERTSAAHVSDHRSKYLGRVAKHMSRAWAYEVRRAVLLCH